jgi:sulfur transfer complex TusBCD TusB component (DsrH family)
VCFGFRLSSSQQINDSDYLLLTDDGTVLAVKAARATLIASTFRPTQRTVSNDAE